MSKPLHNIQKINSVLTDINGFPTEKIVELFDEMRVWDEIEIAYQIYQYKLTFVRTLLGRVRDDSGQRELFNLYTRDEKGNRVRVYKHKKHLSYDDYKQVVAYYAKSGNRGWEMARRLARECKEVHGRQPRLPYYPG